jgi:TonB family protein
MLESTGIKVPAHRAGRRNELALPIAVSALLHILIAALLFSIVTHDTIKEEIVEVFVIGDGGSSKSGINGEAGLPGKAAGGSGMQNALQVKTAAEPGTIETPLSEPPLELQRAPLPAQKDQRVMRLDSMHDPAEKRVLKVPAPQPMAQQKAFAQAVADQVTAALSDKSKSSGLNAGENVQGSGSGAGVGPGAGTGQGSTGFGTGTGGGGIGTGGILHTKFGSSDAPGFLYREIPQYPFAARRRGEEGKVVLKLTIDEKGNLLNIEVIESTGSDFTVSAIEAVKHSKFSPAKKNNTPVVCMALLPIRFALK